jgi:hypothetical protein
MTLWIIDMRACSSRERLNIVEKNPLDFKDYPQIQTIKKLNGEFEYRVSLKALTPWGKRFTDRASLFTGIAAFAVSGAYAAIQVLDEIVPVEALGLPFLLGGLAWAGSYWFLKSLFSTGSTITINATEIKIPKLIFFWHRINRKHDYQIIIRPHPETKREKAKQELKEKKAKFTGKKFTPKELIYADAYVVEVICNGRTYRILSSYNEEAAKDGHSFIGFVDSKIPKDGQTSGTIAYDAKDQWPEHSGGLGDEL